MTFAEGKRERWNSALARALPAGRQAGASFTQAWEWGEFQERYGRSVLRIHGIEENAELFAQAVVMPLPRGFSYFYLPRGPVWNGEPDEAAWTAFRAEMKRRARASGQIFSRVDPVHMLSAGFPVSATQPQHTTIIDLARTEEELLAAMHQKTRYNIRLAEKKAVDVREETTARGLEEFLRLTRETAERHGIHPEPERYYRVMFDALNVPGGLEPERCSLKVFLASRGGEVLAASLMLYFGKTATYAHGASSQAQKEAMAPYLLHWKAMTQAKARGFVAYDFRGVAPEGAGPAHAWTGITRFKEGFGGARRSFPASFDLPYRFFLYPAYRVAAGVAHRRR